MLELSKHFIKTIRAKDKLFVWVYKLFAENSNDTDINKSELLSVTKKGSKFIIGYTFYCQIETCNSNEQRHI